MIIEQAVADLETDLRGGHNKQILGEGDLDTLAEFDMSAHDNDDFRVVGKDGNRI